MTFSILIMWLLLKNDLKIINTYKFMFSKWDD